MTPPNVTTDETRALKAWYLLELEAMQDELRQLRCLQHQDRTLLLELSELVRHVTGWSVDPSITIQ
jgi:hypothetical protein